MENDRLRKLAGLPEQLNEQNEVEIVKAGKVLGQIEKLINQEGSKFDRIAKKAREDYLKIVANTLVWSLIEVRVEEWTGEDIEEVADQVGMTIEEFSKANPKSIIQLIIGEAKKESLERLQGDDDVLDALEIDYSDIEAHVKGVKY